MIEDIHPVDAHVGLRIRAARHAGQISQGALGAAIGITFQQVQKYERGANRVSASKLWEIANHLGVPISFFFEGLPADIHAEPSDLRTAREYAATPTGRSLLLAAADASDGAVQAVTTILRESAAATRAVRQLASA